MKLRHIIPFLFAALLLTGCGEEHKAKKTVKAFLQENLKTAALSEISFSKLDSTYYISDSLILQLRQQTDEAGCFKKSLRYADKDATGKLNFIEVRYKNEGKPQTHTFYLTPENEQVVAIKR